MNSEDGPQWGEIELAQKANRISLFNLSLGSSLSVRTRCVRHCLCLDGSVSVAVSPVLQALGARRGSQSWIWQRVTIWLIVSFNFTTWNVEFSLMLTHVPVVLLSLPLFHSGSTLCSNISCDSVLLKPLKCLLILILFWSDLGHWVKKQHSLIEN